MDQGYFRRQKLAARSQSQVDSTECAEKVEAMLSTAILHQEDLWNMLMMPEDVAFDPNTGLLTPIAEISFETLRAMKSKLENAMEWCQLAQTRLKTITNSSNSTGQNNQNTGTIYGRHRS